MTVVDCCGLPLTCKSKQAVEYYNAGLKKVLGSLAGCVPDFENAVKEDEEFVLVHCFMVGPCEWEEQCNVLIKL